MTKCAILTILRVQFSSIKCIHLAKLNSVSIKQQLPILCSPSP